MSLVGVRAENLAYCGSFKLVVVGRRRAVGVDVVHVLERDSGVFDRAYQALGQAAALDVGAGDVVRVACRAVAGYFAIDFSRRARPRGRSAQALSRPRPRP